MKEEVYRLLLPSTPRSSPKGPQSWVRAQGTVLRFLAGGPAAPWGLTSPEGQNLEPGGQPPQGVA